MNDPRPESARPRLSVVIPALNEEHTLPALLDDLRALPFATRVVVADGGSTDGTAAQARDRGARVVRTPRGRGAQMNVGASSTSSPWLLFLHADSRLPRQSREALAGWLESPPQEEAAYFRFQLDAHGPWWRIIEGGQRLRERLTGLAYGDQGLLVSRRRWRAIGGIPELPLMEDVEAVRRLRRSGGIHRIEAPLVTSARRYRSEGPVAGFLRNAALISLYGSGVPPERLARWYRPHTPHREEGTPEPRTGASATDPRDTTDPRPVADPRHPADPRNAADPRDLADVRHAAGPADRLLLVFAKAPRRGEVKTRLAADIGHDRAAEIYRSMGRGIVDSLRGGRYRMRVCFTPPDARLEMEAWLGSQGVEFAPQTPGDLGRRMSASFDDAFATASRVAIVGTDAPGVNRALVEHAFELLEGCDAVFGPARDGGYYLLALRRPAPTLFRDIPWSTERVLEGSLARAESEGLRVRTLPALPDVDRLEDLTHLPPGPGR